RNWPPIDCYRPEYQLIPCHRGADKGSGQATAPTLPQPDEARHAAALIWFEPRLDRYNTAPSEIELQPLTDGALRILRPQRAEEIVVTGDSFGLRIKPR